MKEELKEEPENNNPDKCDVCEMELTTNTNQTLFSTYKSLRSML